MGVISPLQGGSEATPPRKLFSSRNMSYFCLIFCVASIFYIHCWEVFWHMVFADGFLFLFKELGLLTNPGHWVRVLDVAGSYMYIVL
jgi:hypothetical protein